MHQVFVIDPHPVVREGIRRILDQNTDLAFAGESDSCTNALDKIVKSAAEIVILDPMACPEGMVSTIEQSQELLPSTPLLVFSGEPDVEQANRALRAGATGYLAKSAAAATIVLAIRQCIDGSGYIQPDIAARLIRSATRNAMELRHELLSTRERQIFMLLANGNGINTIGDQLHISPKTVSTHKFRIMQKLGLSSVYELVRYAIQHQLIDV
jgi:two-component system, NarL family, invasion response regulator UvrY